MSNKNKYKSSFQDEWLSNEVYKKWVKKRVTDDKHKAYCKVCMKPFSVSGLGVKALVFQKERFICKNALQTSSNYNFNWISQMSQQIVAEVRISQPLLV